jgi:hypothetical protein
MISWKLAIPAGLRKAARFMPLAETTSKNGVVRIQWDAMSVPTDGVRHD